MTSTFASDDLAQVLIAPDREFAGFAEGILRAWNGETFANVVEVRGGTLTDLPVASGVEALTYQSGDVLMLSRWKLRSGRGAATYFIGNGGRVIIPGTGAAEKAIAWMRGELAKQIVDDLVAELLVSPAGQTLAAFVLGQRVHVDSVAATETTSSATYTDLATAGPTVSGVSISDSGKALVMVGSFESAVAPSGSGSEGALMSVEISGASSVAPDDDNAVRLSVTNHNASGTNHTVSIRAGAFIAIEGLNPGVHTFQAKYRAFAGFGRFAGRHLAVIAL